MAYQYDQLTKQKIQDLLVDSGCDQTTINQYFHYHDNPSKQINLLRCYRCHLLEKLHEEQKKIDSLDYLVYQLNHNQKNKF